MTTVAGLDVAFSEYTRAEADALYAQGYRVFGQCLQTGGLANNSTLLAVAPINLQVFREAGFYCFGYANANPGTAGWITTSQIVQYTIANAGAEWPNVKEVVIDFEIAGTPWNRVLELASLVQTVKACRIVYTGKYVVDALPPPNTAAFGAAALKLWRTGPAGSGPFPPWIDAPIGWQTGQTTTPSGKDYDIDTFDEQFFLGGDFMAALSDDEQRRMLATLDALNTIPGGLAGAIARIEAAQAAVPAGNGTPTPVTVTGTFSGNVK